MQLTPEQISDLGVSQTEFDALSEREQGFLLADTSESDGTTGKDLTTGAGAGAAGTQSGEDPPAATPAPTAAPTPAPTAAPAATPAPTAAPVAETPAAQPTAAPPPSAKAWKAVAPTDVDTQRDTLRAEKDALFDKFADGDITKDAYQAALKPIEQKLEDLTVATITDKVGTAIAGQSLQEQWDAIVETELKAAVASGVTYTAEQMAELDAAVKRLGQAAPLMHPDKSIAERDAWALQTAMQQVEEKNGLKRAAAAPPAVTAPPGSSAGKVPALEAIPPTLRGAPEGGTPNIDANEFAHIDRMTPAEAEKAVAAMTDAQRERYENS